VLHYLSEPQRAIAEAGRVLAPGGRLLIVDFAPHDCEFLRKDFAHERLGFPESLVSGWIEEGGLRARSVRHLNADPRGEGEKLTVSIWLAERLEVAEPLPRASKPRNLERSRT
jgi:ArsR family transcriptional regulator